MLTGIKPRYISEVFVGPVDSTVGAIEPKERTPIFCNILL